MPLQPIVLSGHLFLAREPAELAGLIGAFADPPTRILLGADGLTTTLLSAWTRGPVRVGHADHRRVSAAEAPAGAAALLLAGDDEELIVRRSVLTGGDGGELSRNVVVARPVLSATAEQCLTDTAAPIGAALQATGTGYRRTVLDAGVRDWDGADAAYKTYLMWHGPKPLAAVTETFNPALVPAVAAVAGADLLAVGGRR
ncbi:chorismate pyruvate-lyase family protein [Kitasatospora sp. NPDC048407]|uniref:chorismate pyruvate-lyase family protein n=1 Tax=Kitasatospora sp. NPDC048407 TaxID=3364051 RepID=UPI00371E7E5A